jgi:hypothetical protein
LLYALAVSLARGVTWLGGLALSAALNQPPCLISPMPRVDIAVLPLVRVGDSSDEPLANCRSLVEP